MKRLLSTASLNTDFATLLLRVLLGGMFLFVHGWMKLQNFDAMLATFPDIIHIGGKLSFYLVLFAEVVCAAFILVGFLTRLAVIPVFITMIVAFFVAHAPQPFDQKMVPFIYLGLCIILFILGSGKYSVDSAIFNRRHQLRN